MAIRSRFLRLAARRPTPTVSENTDMEFARILHRFGAMSDKDLREVADIIAEPENAAVRAAGEVC